MRGFIALGSLGVVFMFMMVSLVSPSVDATFNHPLYFSISYSNSSSSEQLSRVTCLNETTMIAIYDDSNNFYYKIGHFDGYDVSWDTPHLMFTDATALTTAGFGKAYLKTHNTGIYHHIVYTYTSDNGTDDRYGVVKLTFVDFINGSYSISHGSMMYIEGITTDFAFTSAEASEMQVMMVPNVDAFIMVYNQASGTQRMYFYGIEYSVDNLTLRYQYQQTITVYTTTSICTQNSGVLFYSSGISSSSYVEMSYDNSVHKILWLGNGTFSDRIVNNLESYYFDTGTGESILILGRGYTGINQFYLIQFYRPDGGAWDVTPVFNLSLWVLSGLASETDGTPAAYYSVNTDTVIFARGLSYSYGNPHVYIFFRVNGQTKYYYMEYSVTYYNFTVSDFASYREDYQIDAHSLTNQEADFVGRTFDSVVGFVEGYPSSNPAFRLYNYIYDFDDGVPSYDIDFYAEPLDADLNESVDFSYSGDVIPGSVTYVYLFGDGASDGTIYRNATISHAYNISGWYTVTLYVNSSFDDYVLIKTDYIHVGNYTTTDLDYQIRFITDGLVSIFIIFLPAMLLGLYYGRMGVVVGIGIAVTALMFYDADYMVPAIVTYIGLIAMFVRGDG